MAKPISPVQFRISAKNLGQLALPDACERCFWIKTHFDLPYQIFPGIFSSIDSYTKNVVRNYLERNKRMPEWGDALGKVKSYVTVTREGFKWLNKKDSILLTGVPDEIFRRTDHSNLIVDYKTAKFTKTQDKLLPMYQVQLSAYKFIAENIGINPVTGMYLVYFEPPTGKLPEKRLASDTGMMMPFEANVMEIDEGIDIPGLLLHAKKIYSSEPPVGRDGCKDCQKLARMTNSL